MIRRWSSTQRLTALLTGWDTGQLPATSLGCTPSAPRCSQCRMRWLGVSQVSQRRLIFHAKTLKNLKTLKRASPASRRHQSLRRLSACTSLPGCHWRSCGTPHLSHGQSKRAAKPLTQARLSHQVCQRHVSVRGHVFQGIPSGWKAAVQSYHLRSGLRAIRHGLPHTMAQVPCLLSRWPKGVDSPG